MIGTCNFTLCILTSVPSPHLLLLFNILHSPLLQYFPTQTAKKQHPTSEASPQHLPPTSDNRKSTLSLYQDHQPGRQASRPAPSLPLPTRQLSPPQRKPATAVPD
ncbi:hypothetical protein BDV26DRAFT_272294 [Aspergillus bertholletiae]|uniref:Uncharacterized protein n=1 Tax=Aspergillus bertholletiae TaxID=1226010 RepID=A0A5N7AU16_9EURO|nr:hypothetical protein BDV26DRAFT_272294 [Aspergillus bertholletiae]